VRPFRRLELVFRRAEKGGSFPARTEPLIHSNPTDAKRSEVDIAAAKEAEILAALERQQRKLASDAELAKGVTYTESMKSR
jgi:hypothetical protein